jgi:hypothetical protein
MEPITPLSPRVLSKPSSLSPKRDKSLQWTCGKDRNLVSRRLINSGAFGDVYEVRPKHDRLLILFR